MYSLLLLESSYKIEKQAEKGKRYFYIGRIKELRSESGAFTAFETEDFSVQFSDCLIKGFGLRPDSFAIAIRPKRSTPLAYGHLYVEVLVDLKCVHYSKSSRCRAQCFAVSDSLEALKVLFYSDDLMKTHVLICSDILDVNSSTTPVTKRPRLIFSTTTAMGENVKVQPQTETTINDSVVADEDAFVSTLETTPTSDLQELLRSDKNPEPVYDFARCQEDIAMLSQKMDKEIGLLKQLLTAQNSRNNSIDSPNLVDIEDGFSITGEAWHKCFKEQLLGKAVIPLMESLYSEGEKMSSSATGKKSRPALHFTRMTAIYKTLSKLPNLKRSTENSGKFLSEPEQKVVKESINQHLNQKRQSKKKRDKKQELVLDSALPTTD